MASAEGSEVSELIAGNRKDAAVKGNSSSGMACELLQRADTKPLDERRCVKHALELREAATTAGFLPFMCQGPEMPLVHTLDMNVFTKLKEKDATATKGYPAAVVQGPEVPLVHTLELKQANYLAAMRQGLQVHRTLELNTLKPAEYLSSMRQGPEPLTLIPCALVRTIPRCLPQSIPKHVPAPGNLVIEDVEKTALGVQDKLRQKGGPEYCMRTIRATVEILKEKQEKALRRQSLLKKFKAWADDTSRGFTFYSIGEKFDLDRQM
ncbi:unnamed protein product [Triticum turgidum subsp. durum]|uniref:Uncharacterized protein n=1 Tax=Triticum turgidum subsp. durum TaxID=4567 RepID=A0A9R0R6Z8_TRITD|nr:unnamed protein product [Triticum turgidum subsp. durum]